jgi:hypothetical protein
MLPKRRTFVHPNVGRNPKNKKGTQKKWFVNESAKPI